MAWQEPDPDELRRVPEGRVGRTGAEPVHAVLELDPEGQGRALAEVLERDPGSPRPHLRQVPPPLHAHLDVLGVGDRQLRLRKDLHLDREHLPPALEVPDALQVRRHLRVLVEAQPDLPPRPVGAGTEVGDVRPHRQAAGGLLGRHADPVAPLEQPRVRLRVARVVPELPHDAGHEPNVSVRPDLHRPGLRLLELAEPPGEGIAAELRLPLLDLEPERAEGLGIAQLGLEAERDVVQARR